MSRRDQIRMTDDEVRAFLDGRHVMNIATMGPTGRIHLVAMWYAFMPDDNAPAIWTYGKSQKVLNVQRDPRMTALVETGEAYNELKGVELVGIGSVIEDRDIVQAVGERVWERYTGPVDDNARKAVATMGAKRLVVRLDVDTIVSWDHSKLGGTY